MRFPCPLQPMPMILRFLDSCKKRTSNIYLHRLNHQQLHEVLLVLRTKLVSERSDADNFYMISSRNTAD